MDADESKYTKYVELVSSKLTANRDWRVGQTFFNVLYDIRPDLANQIRGTKLDPFYTDDPTKLADFAGFVKDNL